MTQEQTQAFQELANSQNLTFSVVLDVPEVVVPATTETVNFTPAPQS